MSIGIAVYPSDGTDATALLANADAALYRAKAAGRGTIRFFEAHMDERLRERRALQHELRAAIENKELALHYQPQARIGGEIIGFEALVRWHHPIRGMIPPGTFIPLAEESGLIVEHGRMDPARGLPRGRVLAEAADRSPSTSRRSSSATATCRRWCMRSCWKPASRRIASSSRSPRAC